MTGGAADLLNAPSEVLSAPPGALWWVVEPMDLQTAIAQDNSNLPVTLNVLPRDRSLFVASSLVALRVPEFLPVGTRLTYGAKQLFVSAAVQPLDLRDVIVARTYRPELGGVGFTLRVPNGTANRIFVHRGYVVEPNGNVAGGVLALQDLLVSDTPKICSLQVEGSEIFVPVWEGNAAAYSIAVMLTDAYDAGLSPPITQRLSP